ARARCPGGAEGVRAGGPPQQGRGALRPMAALLAPPVPIVSLAKGLEQATALRPSEVIAAVCGGRERVLVLSGPSHAEEIARGLPTTVVLAGPEEQVV